MLGRVLGRLHHDAADRTGDGAELAADAFLEPVGVAMQDMAATLARRGGLLPFRGLDRDDRLGGVLLRRRPGTGEGEGGEEKLAPRPPNVPPGGPGNVARSQT